MPYAGPEFKGSSVMPGTPQHRSIFVAVDGIDGAGKTTQVELLRDSLQQVGETVIVSKEPTKGQWGTIIRESASTGRLSPEQELQAFINDRTEHVEQLIAPALRRGEIVILDRYFYSSIAYQGSRGANVDEVKHIMESRFPTPDAVFILDIDPSLSIHRIAFSRGEQPNHFEERENLKRARSIFKSMSGDVIHHIDGSVSVEAVQQAIMRIFIEQPLKAKRCAKAYGCDDPYHCSYKMTDTCEWLRLRKVLSTTVTFA
jgi:dTMP kinase